MPQSSVREAIIYEAYNGGLVGYFGREKTQQFVQDYFYWPKLVYDMSRIVNRCGNCYEEKKHDNNARLYTSLLILVRWKDLTMDFILSLP